MDKYLRIPHEFLHDYVRRMLHRITQSDPDRRAVNEALIRIYAAIGLPPPTIIWCEIPQELTNLPWLLAVLSQWHEGTADFSNGLNFGDKSAWPPSIWQRPRKIFAEHSGKKSLGRSLNTEFAELLLRKMSPALGDQIENAVAPATKNAIDDQLRSSILRLAELLHDVCAGAAAVRSAPGMQYAPAVYAPPGKKWADSDEEFRDTSLRPDAVYTNAWRPATLVWLLTYDCIRACAKTSIYNKELDQLLTDFLTLLQNAQLFAVFEQFCFVCPYPLKFSVDENMRFHGGNEAAIQTRDGKKEYYWHGNPVPKFWIEHLDALNPYLIDFEGNIERRRMMMEIYGFERYLRQSNAQKIHSDECGVLYKKVLRRPEEPIVAVEVVNSTPEPDGTYKRYFLRVPPDITTARAAVAWTFSLTPEEYAPNVQT